MYTQYIRNLYMRITICSQGESPSGPIAWPDIENLLSVCYITCMSVYT